MSDALKGNRLMMAKTLWVFYQYIPIDNHLLIFDLFFTNMFKMRQFLYQIN